MSTLAPATAEGIVPGSSRAWLIAARPLTLPLGVAPVLIGAALGRYAGGAERFAPLAAVAALLGAIALQIGANFANDLFDGLRGTDDGERLGPVRATQSGLLSRQQVRGGMVLSFAFAALAGLYLVWISGWAIAAIGVASILAAIAYTGGPYPLGYHGLGELFVLLFFGFAAVSGTTFAASGEWHPALTLPAGAAIGLLACAVLAINNLRDREGDMRSGKRTLAARFGRRFAELEIALCFALAGVVPAALAAAKLAPPTIFLALAPAPMALRTLLDLKRAEGRALNPLLAKTGRITLLYAALFSAGLMPW